MRNMSFMLTTEQFKNKSKRKTRRLGWWFLKPGDIVMGVEKGMGLKRGEVIVKLGPFIVEVTYPEPLKLITQEEVILEGFPDKDPEWFIGMFCKSHKKCTPETVVNTIGFDYI